MDDDDKKGQDDDDEEEMAFQTSDTGDDVRAKSPDEWENPQAPPDDRRAPPVP